MPEILAAWKYSDRVAVARQEKLSEPGSYGEMIHQVIADACNIKVYAARGFDLGLKDCLQPVFTLDLPNAGDALFNGPWGYRAQYWLGASHGIAANHELIAALRQKLLGAVDLSAAPDLAKVDLCASLTAASAKIWIRESLSLTDTPAGLAVERWADEAKEGVELARLGLQAPEAVKFEVKGALLDPYGNEVVPGRKIRRHVDIHHYGFS